MREIFLGIMVILFIVCFFKASLCIKNEKQYGVLILGVMFFLFGISILLNFALISQNDELTEKVKNKCPEYEEVPNVYILKK
jgi:hypothetical protein